LRQTFANKFIRAFDAVSRAGGTEDFELGLVRLETIAAQAAKFGIQKDFVVLSWSEALSKSHIGVHCSCVAFQKYQELCHHAWAALLAFDQSNQFEIIEAREAFKDAPLTIMHLAEDRALFIMRDAINLESSAQWPALKIDPTGFINFTHHQKSGDYTLLSFGFDYGAFKTSVTSKRKDFLDPSKERRIKRNQSAEKELLKEFKGAVALSKMHKQKLSGVEMKAFISAHPTPNWQTLVDGKRVVSLDVSEARLEKSQSHFELTAHFTSGDQSFTLTDVLGHPSSNSALITMQDGSPALLNDEWAKRLELLSRGASLSKNGTLEFSRASLPLFMPAFEGAKNLELSPEAKAVFDSISSLSEIGRTEAPLTLKGTLRPYQAEGLFWLLKMCESGFGGLLADDMGLGKTIQIISYFLMRRMHFRKVPADQKPSLVVVPKSLVSNWKNEIEKFGSTLRVLDFAGANRVIFRPQHFDIVLTTYHVLKNEIDRLKLTEFDSIILDEAQAIKNPTSQISNAVFQLQGRQRFALSGTPIENSLRDLFSLLHFTNPGLIPKAFERIYSDRKSLDLPKAVTEKMAASVRPFILRRTKKQVLTELPDKSEQILICEMEGPQKALYDKMRKHFKVKLKESENETSSGPKPARIFEALLRLRQISCHPALIGKMGESIESTKVEILLEHLEEIHAAGNKALVFSQFTSFLDLLKPELLRAGLSFEHLDGKTRNRGAVVDRFNSNPKTTVFLISLKAGGTGLNLTTASYVFLMDPWWNPAIESQAIDRAYRMGQKQKVMAYRLIAQGTIEEKIMKLQDRKRDLAQSLISEDDSLATSISFEDLEYLMEP
jgi:superfamily II DNA or RNA helicase